MASSKIKGIVIEIGGDTSKLQKSLNAVNAPINKINQELNDLNKALKLDPKNTELLAQKQEVLARNIAASKDKLVQLKEAQKQMGDYSKLTDEQKAVYNRLSLEISKSESALKSMNEELKNTSKIDFSKMQQGLKKVGEVALDVSKKMLQISGAIAGAITGVITAGVKSYANLEKAQKGSERLFGESFNIVKSNAASAYRTMGLSASEYYDQVNTYVVGLKNSLKGDTKRAANLANEVLKAQADIVAATGANTDTVQNAFAAVMRGNYTMLDNLRLGIKGSKTGMQEVIQKVNQWNKEQGHATHYQMDNYADMQQALVDYVAMVQVAGAAQSQMSTTITGSLSQMKSAFQNLLSGVGGAADLSSTIKTFLNNVFNAVKKLAPTLLKGIVSVFKNIIPRLVSMTGELMPIVLEGVQGIIDGMIEFINSDSGQFRKIAVDILNNIVKFVLKNLPIILQASIQIISELAIGIGQSAPNLIPAIVECILTIVDTLLDPENIKLIINASFELIKGIIQGIILAIPKIVEKVPNIVKDIAKKIKENVNKMYEAGKDLIDGMWRGLKAQWDYYKAVGGGNGLAGWVKTVIQDIMDKFGIHSPSTVMRDKIGVNLGLGIVEGINDTIGDVENAMSNL